MANNDQLVNFIRSGVEFISEVIVYPGEDEMKALAFNGLLALNGEVEILDYK
jgi:butyrate kinase